MARYESHADRCGRHVSAALPALSVRVARIVARRIGAHQNYDVAAIISVLGALSDGLLLSIPEIGPGALAEIRAAQAATDYTPGHCNWVGEGVPV